MHEPSPSITADRTEHQNIGFTCKCGEEFRTSLGLDRHRDLCDEHPTRPL